MAVTIPKLVLGQIRQGNAIVDARGMPTDTLLRIINGNTDRVTATINSISAVLVDIVTLNNLVTTAQDAAAAAQTAAATAQTAATDAAAASTMRDSYVSGLTLTAADAGSDATITISAHTRHYPQPDGSATAVAVNGGTLTTQPYSTEIWVGYDDAAKTGGAVTYIAANSPIVQSGARHSVGAVTTPAAAGTPIDGNPLRPPGYVEPSV